MVASERKTALHNPLFNTPSTEDESSPDPDIKEVEASEPADETMAVSSALAPVNEVRNRLIALGEEKAGTLRPLRHVEFKIDGKNVQLADEMDELALLGIVGASPEFSRRQDDKDESDTHSHGDESNVDLLGPETTLGAGQGILDAASAGAQADLPNKRRRDED